ncbi:MAG: hypothetical protein A2542_01920 [Parcubacteria group bacterium RIFOXYD2_FULL_52_8]|nr:MAG: hypothetical protein A2542_01920 [Parcubacteria group bacterium RIFOXYD2_FULL_52_8]
MREKKPDKTLFVIVVILIFFGFFIFTSAAFGLLARNGADFTMVVAKQLIIGVVMGALSLLIVSTISYKKWRSWMLPIVCASIVLSLILFLPGVGFSSGGAKRWLSLGIFSFQPSEFLKFGIVLFLATWFGQHKERAQSLVQGFLPFLAAIATAGVLVLAQPDTGTFLVMFTSAIGIFLVAGAPWKYLGTMAVCALVGIIVLASFRPYVKQRLTTFLHPEEDALGSSYQLRQSLIAIGSGGVTGRGFGQSVQKFNFLPEAIGDSIFAVAAEEFGLIGSTILVLLFLCFGLRGMKIAAEAPDAFSRLLVTGLVILIVSQSFINIGAMLGVVPLTGVPLLFVSHGGTALFFALIEVGIILNISRHRTVVA